MEVKVLEKRDGVVTTIKVAKTRKKKVEKKVEKMSTLSGVPLDVVENKD